MKKKIKILDTTLRDGEQAPSCSMTYREKLKIAVQLEKLGVDIIEAGYPASSKEDFKAVKEISKIITYASVAALARGKKEDIDLAYEAVKEAKKPRINVFFPTSRIHLESKLKISEEECLKKVEESVKYATSLCKYVQFVAEDASRTSTVFLKKVFEIAIESGAKSICIADTTGYLLPSETENLVKYLKKNVNKIDKVELAVHMHNDLGMAVANSIFAIKAGATQVECTVNGIGERAGNASLEEVATILKVKEEVLETRTNIIYKEIYNTSKLVSKVIKQNISITKPLVGENAFKHEAGIHQQAILSNKGTYEIIDPKLIGVPEKPLVLGKHSGKAALKVRLNKIGIKLKEEELALFFKDFKDFSSKKIEITDTELKHIYNKAKIKQEILEEEKIKLEKLKEEEKKLKECNKEKNKEKQ